MKRERSISLQEYFSENTVKPRRKRERGQAAVLSFGNHCKWQRKLDKSAEWRKRRLTPTETECRL